MRWHCALLHRAMAAGGVRQMDVRWLEGLQIAATNHEKTMRLRMRPLLRPKFFNLVGITNSYSLKTRRMQSISSVVSNSAYFCVSFFRTSIYLDGRISFKPELGRFLVRSSHWTPVCCQMSGGFHGSLQENADIVPCQTSTFRIIRIQY